MKKILFALSIMMLSLVSSSVEAKIYNLTCSYTTKTIAYNYSGVYNHLWIHINGKQVADRWTYSSGWQSYKPTTTLKYNDTVQIFYKDTTGYGWTSIAYCRGSV